ncbi:MAG TPA: UDP-2,4-diacetamido-2,4,6-trideoxy-beta-L-altropyranose hydrolase [Victivallales bacterium]|nr:UDP-2,4-diacetamido-2,4,6-trideoxy-beta-L-altropyranose hydrolase [Victivallales bacterium]
MENIFIRVDANNKIGMGHLMECLALADSLSEKGSYRTVFILKSTSSGTEILHQKGYETRIISVKSEDDEVKKIKKIVDGYEPKILICDLLNKSNRYYESLKQSVEKLVLIFDHPETRLYSADIVVNFNIAQDKNFYKNADTGKTIYLIGPEYMPISRNLAQKVKKQIKLDCQNILVTQGGSDPFNITIKIIKALELLRLKQKIFVVIGPAVSKELRERIKKLQPSLINDYQFEWSISQERMWDIIKESDLAITAAGNTLYELAIFGIPSVVVCHHENHNIVAEKFAERGAVINLGIGKKITLHDIKETVNLLLHSFDKRETLSENIKKIIDGFGCERLIEKIQTC